MGQIRADVLANIAEHFIATATKKNGVPIALNLKSADVFIISNTRQDAAATGGTN